MSRQRFAAAHTATGPGEPSFLTRPSTVSGASRQPAAIICNDKLTDSRP